MMNDRYLMHYGVKGMKWGIRHDPERKGRETSSLKLSDKQKKILKRIAIGTAIVGGLVGAGVLYSNIQNRKALARYIESGRKVVESKLRETANRGLDNDINDGIKLKSLSKEQVSAINDHRSSIIDARMKNIPNDSINREAEKLGREAFNAAKQNKKIIQENWRINKGLSRKSYGPSFGGRTTPTRYFKSDPRKDYRVPAGWYSDARFGKYGKISDVQYQNSKNVVKEIIDKDGAKGYIQVTKSKSSSSYKYDWEELQKQNKSLLEKILK